MSRVVLACAAFFILAFALRFAGGATESSFGAHDDEPAHMVTGLMVHDYLTESELGNPMRFAEQYYKHYPKVAMGQWPPVFYATQAVWMAAFGVGRVSLIALMSLLAAGVATALFAFLRGEFGTPIAATAGAVFVGLPLVQHFTGLVMTEVPMALLCTLAAMSFGRYLDTGTTRSSVTFGVLASLAILTKGNGIALGLLVPITILMTRRWELLRRPNFWLSAVIVAAICAPWYWITIPITSTTWEGGSSPTLAYSMEAMRFYAIQAVRQGGFVLTAIAGLGLVTRCMERPLSGRWAAMIALLPSLALVYVILPSSINERHLVVALPAWIALFAAGLVWLTQRLPQLRLARMRIVPLVFIAFVLAENFELPRKDYRGIDVAVANLIEDPRFEDSIFMIASDACGEGIFISEMAMRERAREHFVVRATKLLASSDWWGKNYQLRFDSTAELEAYLAAIPVGVIALDSSADPSERLLHLGQLSELFAKSDRWVRVEAFDVVRNGVEYPGALQIYELQGHQALPRRELSLTTVMGRDLGSL